MFGYVLGSPLGTGPDDTKSLADSDALHLRRESPDVIPHAGLDVAGRCRRALQHIELSIGGLDATADASEIMPIRGDRDRLELCARGEAIQPSLAALDDAHVNRPPGLKCFLLCQQ